MVKSIVLDDKTIPVFTYEEENVNGLHKITVDFEVSSEDYHDIATLLYRGAFDVKVPEKGLAFRGSIDQYYTSITNLYEKDQVGDYHICLLEVKG